MDAVSIVEVSSGFSGTCTCIGIGIGSRLVVISEGRGMGILKAVQGVIANIPRPRM